MHKSCKHEGAWQHLVCNLVTGGAGRIHVHMIVSTGQLGNRCVDWGYICTLATSHVSMRVPSWHLVCHLVTGCSGCVHVHMFVSTGHRVRWATGVLTGYIMFACLRNDRVHVRLASTRHLVAGTIWSEVEVPGYCVHERCSGASCVCT